MPARTRWSRAGGNTYAYDDNGNMVSGAGRTLTWTSFNKPATVVDAATRTAFVHGPDRARIRQTRTQGATTTTIKYVASQFEQCERRPARRRNPSTTSSPAASAHRHPHHGQCADAH